MHSGKEPVPTKGCSKDCAFERTDCDTIWALEDLLNEDLLTIETLYSYSIWKSLMAVTIDAQHLVGQDARLGVET